MRVSSMNELESKPKNTVVSLEEIRKRHNQKVQQTSLPLEQQVDILYQDVRMLIDMVIDQEERIDILEDRCWRAIRMMRRMQNGMELIESRTQAQP